MMIRGLLRESDFLTLLSPDQVALELESGMLAAIGAPLEHGAPADRPHHARRLAADRRRSAHFLELLRTAPHAKPDFRKIE